MWYAKFENEKMIYGFQSEPGDDTWTEVEVIDVPYDHDYTWDFSDDIPKMILIPPMLNEVKEQLKIEVERNAAAFYIGEEYQLIYEEAKDFLANKERTYPLLTLTVEIGRNDTLLDAAVEVKQKGDTVIERAMERRRLRLATKMQIDAATSVENARFIYENFLDSLRS
jgi:hypothetical protein